ncbi:MAG: hypothetical protein R3C28_12630 [Pirellulaceae bacterium]
MIRKSRSRFLSLVAALVLFGSGLSIVVAESDSVPSFEWSKPQIRQRMQEVLQKQLDQLDSQLQAETTAVETLEKQLAEKRSESKSWNRPN